MIIPYKEHKFKRITDAKNAGISIGIKRGIEQGIEQGLFLGELHRVTLLVRKKVLKGYELPRIAGELEEDPAAIEPVYDAVLVEAPDYDEERILARLIKTGICIEPFYKEGTKIGRTLEDFAKEIVKMLIQDLKEDLIEKDQEIAALKAQLATVK